jgi:hypothetical protein
MNVHFVNRLSFGWLTSTPITRRSQALERLTRPAPRYPYLPIGKSETVTVVAKGTLMIRN